MALKKKSSIDETLDLIKDAEKFKARIAELKMRERVAAAAEKRSQRRCAQINADMEKSVIAAQGELDTARTTAKAELASIGKAASVVAEAQGEVAKKLKVLSKREAKVVQDRKVIVAERATQREDRSDFENTVLRFRAAVRAACGAVVG